MKRIHIFGASGSGTTTLAKAVADAMGCQHFDTDDYFWVPTDPPYQTIREYPERQKLLREDIEKSESWTLSGSLCGWGDFAMPMIDLAVFLWLPKAVRMQRLRKREVERYGPEIDDPCDPRFEGHKAFLDWAEAYDTGRLDMRSKATHEKWMAVLPCPLVRIEKDRKVQENLKTVMGEIESHKEAESGLSE